MTGIISDIKTNYIRTFIKLTTGKGIEQMTDQGKNIGGSQIQDKNIR